MAGTLVVTELGDGRSLRARRLPPTGTESGLMVADQGANARSW